MEIFSAMVGMNFRPSEARAIAKSLAIGDKLTLEAEPTNPYDVNAVRVIHPESGEFIGFLSKESNLETSAHLNEGGEVECEVCGFLATNKPHLKITLLGEEFPEAEDDSIDSAFGNDEDE